ncbi:hypothetical protein [Aquimarina hainanensis]|uniref:hypothetical protein n=1 Tax=Aquimarina hainanensis TaxID=1578017 RepID=UPI003620443E
MISLYQRGSIFSIILYCIISTFLLSFYWLKITLLYSLVFLQVLQNTKKDIKTSSEYTKTLTPIK